MTRSLYPERIRDTWYATEVYEVIEDGEVKLHRRRHNLGIKGGAEKERAARKAMTQLEVYLRQMQANAEEEAASVTVQAFAESWLASARIDVRPNTVRSYELWARRFVTVYGHLPIRDIKPHHIEKWKQELFANLSPSTVNVALRSVRTMFGKAKRQRLLRQNPFEGVSLADVPQREFPPYWTAEQYRRFIRTVQAPEQARQRAGFALAFYAGLRARECVTLRWEDVRDDLLQVVSREHARTKSGRSRKVPVYAPLREALGELSRLGPYVLSSEYNELSDERILSQKFLKHRRRMPSLPEISFHGLRHSFATNLALAGMPIPVLQKLMGHADISTTMLYTHVQEDAVIETAKRIDPWGEGG